MNRRIDIDSLYNIFLKHPGVVTDSRHISESCLFFALKGERFDGNNFALEALEKGAAYAIVDRDDLPEHDQLLLVDDVLKTLQELANLHRKNLGTPVIAITGTNGKTTTKELIASVLSTTYSLLYTQGNLNNHIGLPLTLLRLNRSHQLALVEMGANHMGDIEELCQIAEPNYGLITNIGMAHLEGFGSIEGVRRTKGELYDWLREHEGKAFICTDDVELMEMLPEIPYVGYGQGEKAVVRGKLREHANQGLNLCFDWFIANQPNQSWSVDTHLVGDYNLNNAIAAIAVGAFFDVPSEKINTALSNYIPSSSRSLLIRTTSGNEIISDAYNANPSSMKIAIDNFIKIETSKSKMMIIGDMNELGDASHDAHQTLWQRLSQLEQEGIGILLCGRIWSKVVGGVHCFEQVSLLNDYLRQNSPRNGLILVKGSNGIGLSQAVDVLKTF